MLGDFELGTRQLGTSSLDDVSGSSYAFGQARADILHTYQGYAQCQADIKKTTNGFGQANCDIKQTYQGYAQCQTEIVSTSQTYGQSQALIIPTRVCGQSQADILTTGRGFGQGQAEIKQTYYSFGQCQALILSGTTRRSFGQAQTYIKWVGVSKVAQVGANITTTTPNATAQAWIYKGAGYAHVRAVIIHTIAWSQAQGRIKRFGAKQNGLAMAFIINKKKQGFAQATIKSKSYGFGQPQGFINKVRGQGQALARMLSFKTQQWSQAQGYIKHTEGVGHVNSHIYRIYPAPYSGGPLTFPGTLSTAGASTRNQLSAEFSVQKGGSVTVVLTQVLNDGGNIGVITTDGSVDMWQNSPAINTPYTFSFDTAAIRTVIVYSWDSSTYRPGLTGIGSFSSDGPFGQARAFILRRIKGFGQAQASVILRGIAFGQAGATIKSTPSKYAQAMAHIIGNTGYGQAKAYIDNGATIYLLDTFTRVESAGIVGTPDIGPDWEAVPDSDSLMEPMSVDGSRLVFDNNIVSDGDDSYGWAWPYSPINAADVEMYAEFILGDVDNCYLEFDLRQEPDYLYCDYYHGDWDIHGRFGGVSLSDSSYPLTSGVTYSIRFIANGTTVRFRVWITGDPEPGSWLFDYDDPAMTTAAGGVAIYIDNDGVLGPTFDYFDNINVSSSNPPAAPVIAGYAQSQAKINAFGVNKNAQATAFIAGQYFRWGQARPSIRKTDNFGIGLAVARILLDEVDIDIYGDSIFNTSNPYQDVVMHDFPSAYYTLNEPLFFADNYTNSNMLYKDTAWDNVGLYDLFRQYGSSNIGPYGGPLVKSFAQLPSGDNAPTFLPSVSAYWNDPTGIPGATGDAGIVSNNEYYGFDYLYRYGASCPISGNRNWTIEFWYRPLQTPLVGGSYAILRVGNVEANDSGAIEFYYDSDNKFKTYFGLGGSSNIGPEFAGPVVEGTWYHIVLASDNVSPTTTSLYINGVLVSSTTQILNAINNTVFIRPNINPGNVFLFDELALYNYDITDTTIPAERITVHYLAGIGFTGSFGQANAYIVGPTKIGQAQATIFSPWQRGHVQAYITTKPHKVAQAQAYIKGYPTGQSQALITRARNGLGQAVGKITRQNTKQGQSAARIVNTQPVGQAQALVDSTRYLVAFNGYHLPGYAQGESIESVAEIKTFGESYRDSTFSEYMGLKNKILSIRMLVMGQNYLDCKNQIELATTLVRSKRSGFSPLYINYFDRHFEAVTQTVSTEANTGNIRTSEYTVDFETKPWLIGDRENLLSGTGLLTTVGRTLDNGGWTPINLHLSGTNITVSGYTDSGDFTGFVSLSGTVSNFEINSEAYETTDNSALNTVDYQIYVGPGVTNFEITGATDCTITYHDRWYL